MFSSGGTLRQTTSGASTAKTSYSGAGGYSGVTSAGQNNAYNTQSYTSQTSTANNKGWFIPFVIERLDQFSIVKSSGKMYH